MITNNLTFDPPTRLPELIQNWIRSSHGHSTSSLKISRKSVQPFSRNVAGNEINKQRKKWLENNTPSPTGGEVIINCTKYQVSYQSRRLGGLKLFRCRWSWVMLDVSISYKLVYATECHYTEWSKKVSHNCIKYWPFFKKSLALCAKNNLQQNNRHRFRHTTNALLHYRVKY